MNGSTRYSLSGVWKANCRPMMNGCRTDCSTCRSVSVCLTWLRVSTSSLRMTFMAYSLPVSLFRACTTLPYVPRPSTRIKSKSSSPTATEGTAAKESEEGSVEGSAGSTWRRYGSSSSLGAAQTQQQRIRAAELSAPAPSGSGSHPPTRARPTGAVAYRGGHAAKGSYRTSIHAACSSEHRTTRPSPTLHRPRTPGELHPRASKTSRVWHENPRSRGASELS